MRPQSPRFHETMSTANATATILDIGGREVPGTIHCQPAKLCDVIGRAADTSLTIEGEAHPTTATTWLAKVACKPRSQHSLMKPAQITTNAAAPYEGGVRKRHQLSKP